MGDKLEEEKEEDDDEIINAEEVDIKDLDQLERKDSVVGKLKRQLSRMSMKKKDRTISITEVSSRITCLKGR